MTKLPAIKFSGMSNNENSFSVCVSQRKNKKIGVIIMDNNNSTININISLNNSFKG